MRAIFTSSVSWDEVLASLSALRNATLTKPFQRNVPFQRDFFWDFVFAVHRYPSSRPKIPIYPSFNAQLQLYRCRPVALPQACGNAAARQRQSYRTAVVELSPPIERRESLHRETGRSRFYLDNEEVCSTSFTTYAYPHSQRENSVYTESLNCVLKRRPNLRTVKPK